VRRSIVVLLASVKLAYSRWVLPKSVPLRSEPRKSDFSSFAFRKSASVIRHSLITTLFKVKPKKLLSPRRQSRNWRGSIERRLSQFAIVQSIPIILHEEKLTAFSLVSVSFIRLRLQFSKRHPINLQDEKKVSLKSQETKVQSSNSALVIFCLHRLTFVKFSANTSILSVIDKEVILDSLVACDFFVNFHCQCHCLIFLRDRKAWEKGSEPFLVVGF